MLSWVSLSFEIVLGTIALIVPNPYFMRFLVPFVTNQLLIYNTAHDYARSSLTFFCTAA